MPTKSEKKRAQKKRAYNQRKANVSVVESIVTPMGNKQEIKCVKNETEQCVVLYHKDKDNSTTEISYEANPHVIGGLSENEFRTLLNSEGYLEDVHIESFVRVITSQSSFKPQPTYYIENPDLIVPIPQGSTHVQILFLRGHNGGIGHWITTYYSSNVLYIYNSIHSTKLHPDAESYLTKLFPYNPPIIFRQVQQQNNSYDCGLYAIANTTSVILGKRPEEQQYNVDQLRSHIADILRTGQLTAFPTKINRQLQMQQVNLKRKSLESMQEKEERLTKAKDYQRAKLLNESHEEKRNRLVKVMTYQKNKLSNESKEENKKRLEALKTYQIKRLASESTEEKENRLKTLKVNQKKKLSNECIEKKEKRLKILKTNQKMRLSNESIEEMEKRLTTLKIKKEKRIQNETVDDKEKRLEMKRTSIQIKRQNECVEESEKRLEKERTNKQIKREKESVQDKEKRLENMRLHKQLNIVNETPQQKQERLKATNDSKKQVTKSKKLQTKSSTKPSYKLATRGIQEYVEVHSLGKMDIICKTCGSKNFLFERPTDTKFTHCCRKGKLHPDQINDFPKYLMDLLTGNDPNSRNFRDNIRKYNSALAFASMGAQVDQIQGRGPFTFRIHGQIYHNTTSLYPAQGSTEKYAQLYIIDTANALAKRMSLDCNKKCRPDVMKKLDELIREINPYCAAFMMLREVEEREIAKAATTNSVIPQINLWICGDRRKDIRRYNLPTCNEVAVVFSSTDGEPPVDRDICIHPRGQASISINQYSENCDPMTYPILFPRGKAGWSIKMTHVDGVKKMTPLQFYTNRLADRNYFNPCLHAGKLTQQFIVDAYVKVESERLTYIRQNQTSLRVELYSGLMDHINNLAANEGAKAGTMMILPSSFQGGSRFMQKMYQNAMAIVREYGKPDLFITATCNPKWAEICDQLEKNETASDRPDIVARVFHGKINSMMKEFLDDHIFGMVIAYIYVIEFQKRGLPHMHLLLILDEKDKIRNKDDIDALVCAEIPDNATEPELYQIVKTNMIHGPCGTVNPNSPCMRDNKCSKRYPKQFQDETFENINGYPLYRRKDNGVKMKILWPNGNVKYMIDNRWIVPYNPYLSKKYKAHINVEICSSVKSIKYICDYLCKGHDCASVKLGQADATKVIQWNEITGYLDARYVSAPESCWRLWEYPLHEKSHVVFQLAVHLQNQQSVVFRHGQEIRAVERAEKRHTTLTAWFLLNHTDSDAHQYHYTDIPKYYVFTSDNIWQKRKKAVKPPIGRMISVTPKDIERFHLRLLLVHALGAKSYEDLRTVNNIKYNTFQEAARAKGILATDNECEKCLDEAVLHKFPRELRELFAYLLSFHTTCDAPMLWKKFKADLIEDYLKKYSSDIAESKCLTDIQTILLLQSLHLADFGLPEPAEFPDSVVVDDIIDVDAEKHEGAKNLAQFNGKQKEIYDLLMKAVNDENCRERYFFIDGPGGTGKTFLYNSVISLLRGDGKTVLAVAWTGIAATLLKGGRTAHSTFKLPVPVNETSVCKIKGNSAAAKIIRDASIIIWDEVTMAPKYALKAIDTLLKDIMNSSKLLGGKVVVLGGDFRQCLPILPFTNHRTAIIETSMLCSTLWPHFKKLSLTENMRVNANEQEFSKYLLTVGNGENVDEDNLIKIPYRCLVNGTLADAIFGQNIIQPDNIYDFIDRAILCAKNDETMKMNDLVLEKIAGPVRVYYSADSADCEENNKICPPMEFLNKLTPTGMPPHKLILKVGAIVMLQRNMNPKRGLCNGTRLIVKEMGNNYLDLEIVTGNCKGERIFLPRIDLKPVDTNMPFLLKRRQFPLRLAFSMTINKSQGQTFDYVGINLEKPVFAHGQLYVAMSRVRSFNNLLIKLPENSKNDSNEYISTNIVFKEILK